ncbi:unnamed product [Ostreococcus tauri]|uniref:Unnamed product n=1 Tax=Ostreococcus tauri TaxID=70448 RepID=A0A090MB50_OSTTA|nr:unnamed product [Ostreococcus tauri]OUS46666.1 hypothetical protein BE221DRAFT_191838 [Ostreococcus tauri]CEF99962.1 unnamed product [Ostreococcus tauri]|eukprot:XP_022840132.1 unnamed product [Ostreococcus tauri]
MRVLSAPLLILTLFPLPRANALEVVTTQRTDNPSVNRVFANGLDAFGRDATCRACHALTRALNDNLISALVDIRGKAKTNANYGKMDDAIETAIAPVCRLSATWRDVDVRKACEKIMERSEDAVAATYHRWLARGGGREERTVRGEKKSRNAWRKWDPVGWNWNYEMCGKATRACKEALSMHELEEFDEDDVAEGDSRKYRSEQRPKRGEMVDGMLKVTAGTFHEEAVRRESDVVVYVGFPKLDKWAHFYAASVLGTVREMFHANETARGFLEIAYVDGTVNDVPPPYGSDDQTPTVAMFAAGNKNWPRYMTDMNDGKLTPFEVLQFIMRTTTSAETLRHANWLATTLKHDVLHKKMWEDDHVEL